MSIILNIENLLSLADVEDLSMVENRKSSYDSKQCGWDGITDEECVIRDCCYIQVSKFSYCYYKISKTSIVSIIYFY